MSHTYQLGDGKPRGVRSVRIITSFLTSCTAFLQYAGVYLDRHPSDAAGLLRHMQQVGQLSVPGLGTAWRDLTTNFVVPASYLPSNIRVV